MNSFAALVIDSDDEETPKVSNNKKTTTQAKGAAGAKPAAKSNAPARVIPGMKPKPAAPVAPAAPSAEFEAEDPTMAKVNDRGGKNREKYGGHSTPKGAVPNDKRAHKDRHDYNRTPRGGGKEGVRGGRGPGGWGSHEEEAQRAAKNPEEVLEEAAVVEEPEEESQPEETGPAVMGLDEYLARRNAQRNNSALFGESKERSVEVDSSLKVVQRESNPEDQVESAKGAKKSQRTKVSMEAAYKVSSGNEYVPRERNSEGGRGGRGGRGRGDRDNGRGRGRGGRGHENRGPSVKLNAEDFPAL